MAKLVLDTNVYVHAMRDEEARRELAAWQRRMALHLHLHSVADFGLIARVERRLSFMLPLP